MSDDFTTGTPIVVDRSTLPGDDHRFEVGGTDCEGHYRVVLVVKGADARTAALDLAPGDDAFLDLPGP